MKRQLIPLPKKQELKPAEVISNSSFSSPSITTIIHEKERWIIKSDRPPQEIFEALRQHQIQAAKEKVKQLDYYSEDDQELLEEVEMEVIRDDYKEHKKYIEKTENIYGRTALWIKNPYIPFRCKWITANSQLMNHLGKKTRFMDVYNYLDNKIEASGEELFPSRYTKTGKAWPYAIIRVNKAFYDEMALKLSLHEKSITRISIEKYLRAFCDLGILIQLTRGGGKTRRDSLYAIGYWVPFRDGYRVQNFLTKDNPGIDKLLEFSVFRL